MCVIILHLFDIECERKIQIYGKTKVHIFRKLKKRPNLIEYITKQSQYHNILKSNLLAGMPPRCSLRQDNGVSLTSHNAERNSFVDDFCSQLIQCGLNSPCSLYTWV